MQAVGRKPPAAIRTRGARAAEGRLQLRSQGRLPADCRPAADYASGWAEAPGCGSHRRCVHWRGRLRPRLQPRLAAETHRYWSIYTPLRVVMRGVFE